MKIALKLFDFFSSVKLAVILIVSIATLLAVGTFYESSHGTVMAQKFVYHSWYATVLMILLILNLACAAIDRYPWKKHHIGFVITHLGIIIMIFGSIMTQQRGIDGILFVGINETANYFSVDDTEIRVYQSFDSRPFVSLSKTPVDFDRRPPEKNNYSFKLVDDDVLKITRYISKGIRKVDVTTTENPLALPSLKFKLQNPQVTTEEWLGLDPALPPFFDLGPAVVTFIRGELPKPPQPKNQVVVYQNPKTEKLSYAVFSSRQDKPTSKGDLKVGEEVATGWMGLKFSITQYVPHSKINIDYTPTDSEAPGATSAIQGQIGERSAWFELDSPHEIRGDKSHYFLSFARKRFELGFNVTLNKFKMALYGGSTMASGYESTITINKDPETKLISMNEPLRHNGFTLYQASFEQNERGEPIASVFSVNYDPGRYLKYFGAICMVCGIITMFYLKPRWTRKKVAS